MRSKMRTRIGSILLVAVMLLSLLPAGTLAATTTFSDIQNHWGKNAIERWSSYGIVSGTGDGIFSPDADITRAEMAQIYVNLLHLTEKADISNFTDVAANAWYADAVAKCVAAGIFSGTSATTFSPAAPITREQMFVTFGHVLGLSPVDTTKTTFTDLPQVSDWAKGMVYAMLEAGYISGVGDNMLMPLIPINRASVMVLMDAVVTGYGNKAGAIVDVTGKNSLVLVVSGDVTITGQIGNVIITQGAANGTVTLDDATVTGTVTFSSPTTRLRLMGDTNVENLIVGTDATDAVVSVDKGASVDILTTKSEGTTVSGVGTVSRVVAEEGSKDVKVTTSGTTVENNSSEPVTTDKGTVKPGETATTSKPSTGGGGGGGGSTVTSYTITFAANGGTGNMSSVSVTSGASYNLPACTLGAPANQKFKAWKVGETEYAVGATITVSGNVTVTAVWEDTASKQAVDAAWDDLNTALTGITGNDGAQIVTAGGGNGAYTLTLDVDAIQATDGAFEDDQLTGLATAVKNALDEHFGDYTLTVDGQAVYANEVFNNTALKNALFSVADGFFYTLGNMTADDNGVYTYKTVDAQAAGTDDTYNFTVDVQLKGDDVEKVQGLATTLADHLAMEKLDATTVTERYGSIDLNGEEEVIVVTMEMPDALMQTAVNMVTSNGANEITAEQMQTTFDGVNVGTYLEILKASEIDLSAILGSGAAEVNSVLSTVNNNANLINKVLGKLIVQVNDKNFFTTEHGTFTPGTEGDAYHKFMTGIYNMTSSDIKAMTPAQFKSTGSKDGTYYAVPVTVEIGLESSMGFSATETVVVVMHIDFSKYISNTNAQD